MSAPLFMISKQKCVSLEFLWVRKNNKIIMSDQKVLIKSLEKSRSSSLLVKGAVHPIMKV